MRKQTSYMQCKTVQADVMVRQLTALLHIFTNQHCAWVLMNGLHAHGVKLFAVATDYQLKIPVDKQISLSQRLSFNYLDQIPFTILNWSK